MPIYHVEFDLNDDAECHNHFYYSKESDVCELLSDAIEGNYGIVLSNIKVIKQEQK